MNETLKYILDNNPGLVNIVLTGVVLPIGILYMSNKNNRRLKEIEKKIESDFKAKDDIREQEKKVYASLSRILFEVQQLHVSLSGHCVDTKCIQQALGKFDEAISKCHNSIADNMLNLSSESINLVYKFYNAIGELKIQLQKLDETKQYDIANATVYYSSEKLADIVIEIQELFVSQRSDLKIQFDASKQEMMKYCCGAQPPEELRKKYLKLLKSMQEQQMETGVPDFVSERLLKEDQ